jgi:hypothetical protein
VRIAPDAIGAAAIQNTADCRPADMNFLTPPHLANLISEKMICN